MYRVRKLNRRSLANEPSSRGRRPRLKDFQDAWKSARKREFLVKPHTLQALQDFNRDLNAPRGALKSINDLRDGYTGLIVVPLSAAGVAPSMAEVARVATAVRLRQFLETRGLAPCLIALWPGLPAPLDDSPRYMIDREGLAHAEHLDLESTADSLLNDFPQTGFTDAIRSDLREDWASKPYASKVRLIFRYLLKKNGIALPPLGGSSFQDMENSPDRGQVERLLNGALEALCYGFPVISIIQPMTGQAADLIHQNQEFMDESIVFFPSGNATLVEAKVERWIEKFELAPEALMQSEFDLGEVLDEKFSGNPDVELVKTKERLLDRVFSLEHQLREEGFANDSRLDKLANQIDKQLDHIREICRKVSTQERKTATNQLAKARQYLRPNGGWQTERMSLLHYLNFYGPEFAPAFADSIELGDTRHHLIYLGN